MHFEQPYYRAQDADFTPIHPVTMPDANGNASPDAVDFHVRPSAPSDVVRHPRINLSLTSLAFARARATSVGGSQDNLALCRLVGTRLRESPFLLRWYVGHVHELHGRPRSAWPKFVRFDSGEPGVRWGIDWNRPSCPFCSLAYRPDVVFESPEDLLLHLRVFHSVFEYRLVQMPNLCTFLVSATSCLCSMQLRFLTALASSLRWKQMTLPKFRDVALREHPERTLGKELVFVNGKRY